MSQERSIMTQNAAFSTARTITANYEQKLILKDWKGKDGADNYKQKKSGEILQSAAKMVGLTPDDIRANINKVEASIKKKPVGAIIDGRLERKPAPRRPQITKKPFSPQEKSPQDRSYGSSGDQTKGSFQEGKKNERKRREERNV